MPISRRLPFNRADRRVRGTRASAGAGVVRYSLRSVNFVLRTFSPTRSSRFRHTIFVRSNRSYDLSRFLSNLRLTAAEVADISLRRKRVREAVGKKGDNSWERDRDG